MPTLLTWNEVRSRAIRFSRDWAEATDEERDKQSFWNDFFDVFGVPRRSVAVFEHAVATAKGSYGFLDLFWPGVLLVEHKSAGASLAKAESQAFRYLEDLARSGSHDQLPRWVIVCDFARFALYDLEPDDQRDLPLFDTGRPYRLVEFELRELHRHAREFAFIKGEKPVRLDPEDPANLKATQLLADLHDAIQTTGYDGHDLERYLVRLLFCFFAEDTGIFEPGCFTNLIALSRADGADTGLRLAQLWDVLNTDPERRQRNLDEDLAAFPWVNGGLFAENLRVCQFDKGLRNALVACTQFHWAKISPAVFGSLFQGVMDDRQRRQIGAHYTSERDIMKVLRSLFLDELRAELDAALADRSTNRTKRLRAFQAKLRSMKFFDPACGCGNFLILAYRELRRLENEVLVAIHGTGIADMYDVRNMALVDVDQFYGIEIGEWPARIAEVGLWLTDHQCNVELAEALGTTCRRLPLKAAPTIRIGNALRVDWQEFLRPTDDVLVFGNPPFVGGKYQTQPQRDDMAAVAAGVENAGLLDYVCGWYLKAAEYTRGTRIRCAFVSTNSITQGEQAGVIWNYLFQRHGIKIHFGHRTFPWMSEARGRAHVHVVIIGFAAFDHPGKVIYDYAAAGSEPTVVEVSNISPYLSEGPDKAITNRSTPICSVPELAMGNQPIDGGHYLFTPDEKMAFLASEPAAKPFFMLWLGADEFINGIERWYLWLGLTRPEQLRRLPQCLKRVEAVRAYRLASKRKQTIKLAETPTRFQTENIPSGQYLVIPEVSSERRRYIPLGFLGPEVLCSNKLRIMRDATIFHFGVLTSAMHMAWTNAVTGRLKSDYQYSVKLVYNNFPWPAEVSEKDRASVEACAQAVLDARAQFPASTLADLYDPLTMPAPLVKAHAALDRAVDRCYRPKAFNSDRERVEHLFAMYEKLAAPLLPTNKARRQRQRT
jgi:hypothetical protein